MRVRPSERKSPRSCGQKGAQPHHGTMPHYHFHLHNRIGFVPDQEGLELPDLQAAREQALRSIRSIVSADVLDGLIDLNGGIEVMDGGPEPIAVIPFADAFQLEGGGA